MTNLKFYGLGGQGVVTAAKNLSIAVSLHEGAYAITVPAYGHERRGAPVYTDVVMDSEPVLVNCFVYEPDIVLVLDETIIEKGIDVGKGRKEHTSLVLNTADPAVARQYQEDYGFAKVYYTDATSHALQCIGRGIPNSAMLGALAATGLVKIESIETVLRESFGEKGGERNAKAARQAYDSTTAI